MNLVSRPRVADVAMADLRAVRERLGAVNFARDMPPPPPPGRPGGGSCTAT